MADTPWTKWPWTIWDGDIVAQSDACNPIVTLYHDTSDADARLIAAAPDMAEALAALLREYVELLESGDCGNWDTEKDEVVINARAALAKARGDQ